MVIVPPVIEEIFFRGVLQSLLGVWVANLLFSLGHGGFNRDLLIYNLLAFLLGLFLSGLYVSSGYLLAPITAHMTINLFSSLRLLQRKRNYGL